MCQVFYNYIVKLYYISLRKTYLQFPMKKIKDTKIKLCVQDHVVSGTAKI